MEFSPIYPDLRWRVAAWWSVCRRIPRSTLHNAEKLHNHAGLASRGSERAANCRSPPVPTTLFGARSDPGGAKPFVLATASARVRHLGGQGRVEAARIGAWLILRRSWWGFCIRVRWGGWWAGGWWGAGLRCSGLPTGGDLNRSGGRRRLG